MRIASARCAGWLVCLLAIGVWAESRCRASEDRPPPPPALERLPLQRYEYDFVAMGMKYHLVVYGPDQPTVTFAIEQVEARVRQLDRVMSDYHTESELSQLCEHSGPGQPVRLSLELYEILDHSLELSRETDGAFDVTVGPVIQLWRTARRTKTLPMPALLAKARERVGWQAVQLHPLTRSAELTREEMQLDLGGIAAGYACDEALQVLRSHGLHRVLIDASGDVLVGDPPPDRAGWKVMVAGLSGVANDPGSQTILLRNAAITTSGDARQYVEIDGQRYSHIVDPHTGLGLTRHSSSTVIAPTGWQADSYATAVNVLGAQAGIPWIEQQPGCSALVIEVQDGVEMRTESRGFPPVTP
jgi:FAD:protein FMN transferase